MDGLGAHRIEIVAAIDEEDFHAFQQQINASIISTYEGPESTEEKKIDEAAHLEQPQFQQFSALFPTELERIKKELIQRYQTPGIKPAGAPSEVNKPLPSAGHLIQEESISPDKTSLPDMDFLMSRGVDPSAAQVVHLKMVMNKGFFDAQNPEIFFNTLKKEIASIILATGPICLSKEGPTPIAIVGPSGVGKTTTLIKIALEYARELNKSVVFFSLDKHSIGAFEQAEIIAAHFQLPFVRIENRSQLIEAMNAYNYCDLILIDTFGCSPHQGDLMDELENILSAVENLQVHLAVSATMKDIDALAAVRQYSRFLPESLILTKADETLSLGIALNLCHQTRMAFSYLTNGPYVPHDLKVADPDEIAHDLLIES